MGDGAGDEFMRMRVVTVALLVLLLLLPSCSVLDKTTWQGRVGQGEVRARVGQAVVVFPDGVAPAGTGATVRLKSGSEASTAGVVSMSEVVEVTLDGGLQPMVPVTITIPVRTDEVATPSVVADEFWLFVSSVEADGAESFVAGSFEPATSSYSVTVDHFSDFRVLGIDIGAAMAEVRTAFMQGIGLEYPAPGCVGKAATVQGTKYEVVSPPGAHLCVEETRGSVVLTAYPAIAMPYLVTSKPRVDGITAATEVTLGASGVIAFATALGFIGNRSKTGVFPGAEASYRFEGAPRSIELDLEQYPVLLLMVILAKTLDTLGITSIDELDGLQCLGDVAEANSSLNEGVTGEGVGTFARSFFSCAGTVGGLTPLGKFLIAAIGSAPALLATSIVGIINELPGQAARQHVDVTVTPALITRLTDDELLDAELPPDVCFTGEFGWSHASPIRLSGGKGSALAADGSFGGASILETQVLGRADLDGDAKEEIVLSLQCTGSLPEDCCAGRTSISTAVVVLTQSGQTLTKVAPTLMGGASEPGNEYGPADRQIASAALRDGTIVTNEYIAYPEQYTPAQVGGDPFLPVSVEYELNQGTWTASRP